MGNDHKEIGGVEPQTPLPLTGIRVVALEQAVAGPFCSRQMADMGADVIKVERPDGGDFARQYDRAVDGLSAYFVWLNRGKRSVVLDLKEKRDHEALTKLIARADIFLHNLAPGAVERLGFGFEQLAATHPALIWCGISGYGPDGPYRDKKAYDLLIQAEAGVVSLTGSADAAAKVGISVADIAAGMYAYSSVLAALLNRNRTGKGTRIDISMFECLTEWVMPPMYVWQGTGVVPAREGMRHNMIVPYGAYQCKDGIVYLAIQNDREWRRFCQEVLQAPAIASDERFLTNQDRLRNRAALESEIDRLLGAENMLTVSERLERASIANARMNDVKAVAEHPQLAARNRWQTAGTPNGDIPALAPPHNLEDAPPVMGSVPSLGQHTKEVLAELGVE